LVSAEALTIGGLSLVARLAIGTGIASLFGMLLRVIFLIPPAGLTWPVSELILLLGLAVTGMGTGVWLANRQLAGLRVSEVLREV
jgi:hypothetical protein